MKGRKGNREGGKERNGMDNFSKKACFGFRCALLPQNKLKIALMSNS